MYNLRYHIASLVAVFLALSLGLLLGGITVQSGVLTSQRAALVQSLRSDFTKLSSTNQTLQQDLRLERQLASALVDKAIAGRLAGKDVLVLTNSGRVEGLAATEAAIRGAGGTPVVLALQRPRLGLADAETASMTASALGVRPGSDVLGQTAEALAKEWANGASGPITDVLARAGVFSAADLPKNGFAGAVDLATFDGKADSGAIAFTAALQKQGVPAVVAQTRQSKSGLASAANAEGVSTLDTIGTETGRYTVVLLLTGAEPGYYGVGQGTVAPFPSPESAP